MRTPASKPPAPRDRVTRPPVLALVGAILAFTLAVVAGIAYVTRDSGPRARHEPAALAPTAAAKPIVWQQPAPAAVPAMPALSPAMPAAPPDAVKKATEEATAQLEAYRSSIVSECWPSGGLPGGAKSAKVTLHVTFDAQGREIARGISEDRRAPSGAFGTCLRKLSGTTLSLPPPGRTVAVSIPVSYP